VNDFRKLDTDLRRKVQIVSVKISEILLEKKEKK